MERYNLPESIKMVFAELGIESMLSIKFTYALMDFGAFDEIPALRPIVRDFIVEGYAQKVYDLLSKNEVANDKLSLLLNTYLQDFNFKLGYKETLSQYTFHSFFYALGFLSNEPNCAGNAVVTESTVNFSHPKSASQLNISASPKVQVRSQKQFFVIKFEPATADLYIDGILQPASYGDWAEELTLGKHNFLLQCQGYIPHTEDVELSANAKTALKIALKEDTTKVEISLNPENLHTEVWVDGNYLGLGSQNVMCEKGKHEVLCRRSSCYDSIERISVTNISTSFKLKKLVPITGTLKVNVKPYGSIISIDGKRVGESPMIIDNLQVGVIKVAIKTEEGDTINEIVDIKDGEIYEITKSLTTNICSDISDMEIGDSVFEDGTFSHKNLPNKKRVGILVSKQTCQSDQQKGWNKGIIMATKFRVDYSNSAKKIKWGSRGYLQSQLEFATKSNVIETIEHGKVAESGFGICHDPLLLKDELFPLFSQGISLSLRTPNNSSGWYVPTIEQIVEMAHELCGIKSYTQNSDGITVKLHSVKKILPSFIGKTFWTCSLKSNNFAWTWRVNSYNELFLKHETITSNNAVLLFASI